MALSQADHIEAARQQVLNRRRDAEAEIREINAALEGLDTAARLIAGKAGKPGFFKSESEHDERPARTIANRHVTAHAGRARQSVVPASPFGGDAGCTP
jgi:hypothetical protein